MIKIHVSEKNYFISPRDLYQNIFFMVATIQDFQSTQKNILQGIIQMVQWFQRRKITYLSSHKVLCKTMSYGGVHLEFLIHTKNMIKAMERLFVYNLGLIKVCTFEKNY